MTENKKMNHLRIIDSIEQLEKEISNLEGLYLNIVGTVKIHESSLTEQPNIPKNDTNLATFLANTDIIIMDLAKRIKCLTSQLEEVLFNKK
jgi:hypothetical protein